MKNDVESERERDRIGVDYAMDETATTRVCRGTLGSREFLSFAFLACLGMGIGTVAFPLSSWPQSGAGHHSASATLVGTVTGVHGSAIQVDRKTYTLHPSVSVIDDEGGVRDLAQVHKGARIQFYVKQRKVDKIIVLLPK